MFTTGETVDLAEWIIDDTCLVFLILLSSLLDITVADEVRLLSYMYNCTIKITIKGENIYMYINRSLISQSYIFYCGNFLGG